jgi:hypothetical protein
MATWHAHRWLVVFMLLASAATVLAILSGHSHTYRPELQTPEFERSEIARSCKNVYSVPSTVKLIGDGSVSLSQDRVSVVFLNPSYSPYDAIELPELVAASRAFGGRVPFYFQNLDDMKEARAYLLTRGVHFHENVLLILVNGDVVAFQQGLPSKGEIVAMIEPRVPFWWKW